MNRHRQQRTIKRPHRQEVKAGDTTFRILQMKPNGHVVVEVTSSEEVQIVDTEKVAQIEGDGVE